MTRDEAIQETSLELVEKLERMNCEYYKPTKFEGSSWWTSWTVLDCGEILMAYYLVDDAKLAKLDDAGEYPWEISHYTIAGEE